jgi:hypothetical protein
LGASIFYFETGAKALPQSIKEFVATNKQKLKKYYKGAYSPGII